MPQLTVKMLINVFRTFSLKRTSYIHKLSKRATYGELSAVFNIDVIILLFGCVHRRVKVILLIDLATFNPVRTFTGAITDTQT